MTQTPTQRATQTENWARAIVRRLGLSDVDPGAISEVAAVVSQAYHRGLRDGESAGHKDGWRDGRKDLKRSVQLRERYAVEGVCHHCGEELPADTADGLTGVHNCADEGRPCYAETD